MACVLWQRAGFTLLDVRNTLPPEQNSSAFEAGLDQCMKDTVHRFSSDSPFFPLALWKAF